MIGESEVPTGRLEARSSSKLPHIRFSDKFFAPSSHGESSRSSSFVSASQGSIPLSRSDDVANDVEGGRRVNPSNNEMNPSSPQNSGRKSTRKKRNSHTPGLSPLKLESLMPDFQPSAFSDEYDLSQEDQKILQDVQRALQYQSRRRSRRSVHAKPLDDGASSLPHGSLPHASSSSPAPAAEVPADRLPVQQFRSDVDFSPSTRSVPLHPVPMSSNGGATLDWAGSQSESERHDRLWPLQRGKSKYKERASPSNQPIVEKQEALFTDRISRIKTEASAPTARRASIVKEQLGRQYNLICATVAQGDPLNLCEVVRWYASSTPEMRAWLESAEPLLWLRHLSNHQGKYSSMWHVSALIMEEYTRFKKGMAQVLPSRPLSGTANLSPVFPLRHPSSFVKHSIPLAASSDPSLSSSLGRVRSAEGYVSFRPGVYRSRDSIDVSQGHEDTRVKSLRRSLPGFVESASVYVPYLRHSNVTPPSRVSPSSSRFHFLDTSHSSQPRIYESDEGSPAGSQYDHQMDSVFPASRQRTKSPEPPLLAAGFQPPRESVTALGGLGETHHPHVSEHLGPIPAALSSEDASDIKATSQHDPPSQTSRHAKDLRLFRSESLPYGNNISFDSDSECDEEKIKEEYDLRWRILQGLKTNNHGLRHSMQRIASDIREYENLCSSVMPAFGIPHRSLPPEILDSASHDPSSVTGRTQRYGGWRAVEDIHERVMRQRDIINQFLAGADEKDLAFPESVLDQPISSLMEKLIVLKKEQQPLCEKADEVTKVLAQVKSVHADVKQEYNDALSQTSVAYPELSQIVVLVERYQDQYQQIWEFGMDALTFILDTITPFWRTYGKTIGEDTQDFLIIPWYRNEFTGEAKRYPVVSVPQRSLRHHCALMALFVVTVLVTVLQTRAAITSTWHYRLLWIESQGFRWIILPFFWMAIVIQWIAVVIELCTVFLQIAVVAWWIGWFIGICT